MMKRIAIIAATVVWVITAFVLSSIVVGALFAGLAQLGLAFSFLSDTTFETAIAAITYVVTIVVTIGVPWLVAKRTTSRTELGLTRMIAWKDIGLALLGVIVYIICSMLLVMAAGFVNGFNPEQAQDIGFSHVSMRYEYVLAFVTLVLMAPFVEELLFRGYLFGKIKKRASFWGTAIVVSLAFALLHLPGVDAAGQLQLQWNVVVDVFALSLVLCGLRQLTGSIWAGVLLHALKNGIAFYILFMAPLLHTMGA